MTQLDVAEWDRAEEKFYTENSTPIVGYTKLEYIDEVIHILEEVSTREQPWIETTTIVESTQEI